MPPGTGAGTPKRASRYLRPCLGVPPPAVLKGVVWFCLSSVLNFYKEVFCRSRWCGEGRAYKKRRARDGVLLFLIGLICGAFFELRPVGDAGGNGNFASRYPAHGSRRRDFLKKVAADL